MLLPHSERKKKKSCNKNSRKNTEMLEKYINNVHVSSRYVFSYVICFHNIHFILISTVHALFLTCLPVSISGT